MNSKKGAIALVADDDATIRDFLGTALRLEGLFLQVVFAPDRDAAMKLALEERPRLILMDYSMPGIAAEQFVNRVRQDLPGCVVVLMTSAHCADEKATELGLRHFLSKPFDVTALREMVRACMQDRVVPAA